MTMTEIRIDSLDHVPDGGEVYAFEMTWQPPGATEPQTRTLNLENVSPGDDRLAIEMTGRATIDAIAIAPPTRHMVVWFVAGHQMKLRREPWQKLQDLFTPLTLKDATLEAVVRINDDAADSMATVGDLDDIELARDDLDPTQAESV